MHQNTVVHEIYYILIINLNRVLPAAYVTTRFDRKLSSFETKAGN